MAKVVFGTIGTLKSHPEYFTQFKYMIIDEAHVTSADEGSMFSKFWEKNQQMKVLGLTATPFRLMNLRGGAKLVMLHHSHIYAGYQHIIQVQDIAKTYWAKINYVSETKADSILRINSTGADYTDKSLALYGKSVDKQIRAIIGKFLNDSVLIFVPSVAQAEEMAKKFPDSACVHGKTPKDVRKRIVAKFKSGEIKRMFNCSVFGIGLDAPGLIAIIDAVPTLSFAKYYQKGGRLTRLHPLGRHIEKFFFDLAGNVARFGKMEDFVIKQVGNVYHGFSGDRQLTGVKMFSEETVFVKPVRGVFQDMEVPYGTFKGKMISEAPKWWLTWAASNFRPGPVLNNIKLFLNGAEPNIVEQEF